MSASGDGRVAVVTGASSGIGEATARLLARDGWHCVLVARREDALRRLAAEIGGEAEVCDVGDRAAVEATAARVLGHHPRLGLLVNNAGTPARATLLDADLDEVERVLAVNYLGSVWCFRALLPGLRAGARGAARHGVGAHVVNVVSVAGTVAFARSGPYVASKHAQLMFSRTLRASLAGSGIAVHTVLPGFVETEGFPQRQLLARRRTRWLVTTPQRVAESIVDAVAKDQAEVTVPWFPYRLVAIAQGVAPGLLRRIAHADVGPRRRLAEASRDTEATPAGFSQPSPLTPAPDGSSQPTPSTPAAAGFNQPGPAAQRAPARVAVVTGASTGIGEATARALADRGWRCVLVARRADLLERLAVEIGGEAERCDLLDRQAVEALGARVLARHPRVGLLVANAGALVRGSFVDADLDAIERVVRLNYLSGVWLTRALLPGLLTTAADGGGDSPHVVAVGSTSGVIAFEPASPYTASKAAQLAFTRSLRGALRGRGVQVHSIMPGFVRTEGFPQPRFFQTPFGRPYVREADDVARTILRAVERETPEVILPAFPYTLGRVAQALLPTTTVRAMSWLRYGD